MPKKKGNYYNISNSSTTLPPRMPKKKGNYYNIHDSSTILPPRNPKKKGNSYNVPDSSTNLTPRIPKKKGNCYNDPDSTIASTKGKGWHCDHLRPFANGSNISEWDVINLLNFCCKEYWLFTIKGLPW